MPEPRPAQPTRPRHPDYRYTLANERTLLAWLRTGLALVAGGVAVATYAPDLGVPWGSGAVALALVLIGLATALAGYRRWRANEDAIRDDRPLPASRLPAVLAAAVAVVVGGRRRPGRGRGARPGDDPRRPSRHAHRRWPGSAPGSGCSRSAALLGAPGVEHRVRVPAGHRRGRRAAGRRGARRAGAGPLPRSCGGGWAAGEGVAAPRRGTAVTVAVVLVAVAALAVAGRSRCRSPRCTTSSRSSRSRKTTAKSLSATARPHARPVDLLAQRPRDGQQPGEVAVVLVEGHQLGDDDVGRGQHRHVHREDGQDLRRGRSGRVSTGCPQVRQRTSTNDAAGDDLDQPVLGRLLHVEARVGQHLRRPLRLRRGDEEVGVVVGFRGAADPGRVAAAERERARRPA